jgi:hypothetical protein
MRKTSHRPRLQKENFVFQGGAERFSYILYRVHGLKKAAHTLGGADTVVFERF